MKRWLIIVPLAAVVAAALWIYGAAERQAGYYGLPVVACIDPTLPVRQNFSLKIQINISGKDVPLAPGIGHDPGKCLRAIHTNDSSGTVFIVSNDSDRPYTLMDFFNVWHERFSSTELLGHFTTATHSLQVFVDGVPVKTFADTLLKANQTILIRYN